MTEAEWLACNDPKAMLKFLGDRASERKLRLFACACCRHVWHLLIDERSRIAVEAAEQLSDGRSSDRDAQVVFASACKASLEVGRIPDAWPETAMRLLRSHHPDTLWRAAFMAGFAVGAGVGDVDAHIRGARGNLVEEVVQTRLLRDIFGPLPFRSVSVEPHWQIPEVQHLAQAIYDDRSYDRLPYLANALEYVGCDTADILNHCRLPGPHVRGCWAIDLLLGKE